MQISALCVLQVTSGVAVSVERVTKSICGLCLQFDSLQQKIRAYQANEEARVAKALQDAGGLC